MPNTEQHIETIKAWLKNQIGERQVVLGMSGGIDSAVVGYLLKQILPAERIHVLIMPTAVTQATDIEDANELANTISHNVRQIPLDSIISAYQAELPEFSTNERSKINLQPRIRMSMLYGVANSVDGLVIGTGNKSELLAGYFTKYGDGGVDLLPIADLYKHEVYAVAKALGVPDKIINKAPSANLYPGQTDEQELGVSYEILDAILGILMSDNAGVALTQFTTEDVKRVQQLIEQSEHKRKLATICYV